MNGGLHFPSDSSDEEPEEYDEPSMAGPEALLFKALGWPLASPNDAARHKGAKRETCPACNGAGWLWVLPTPPTPGRSSRKS